jgi:hypothetical protein
MQDFDTTAVTAVLPDVGYRSDPADVCQGIRAVEPILAID